MRSPGHPAGLREYAVMSLPNQTLMPFEMWASASMAAWRAALDITSSVATASTTWLDQPPSRTGTSSVSAMRELPRPEPRSRSWYKAPYRSPFDPLFWMTPGHPVDHMGEWMNLLRTAGGVQGFPAAFAPPPSPSAAASFLFPWLSFAEKVTEGLQRATRAGEADNIVDFASAYAAYRTAGGHASAQIIRADSSTPSVGQSTRGERDSTSLPFPFALFLPIWLR